MCEQCWEEAGKPTDPPPGMDRFVALVEELYEAHPTGGPLHVVLDDWNLDGDIVPAYQFFTPEELDALWYHGFLVADLPPDAPAVVDGLGRSTRTMCEEICQIMNGWTGVQRAAAMAHWDGFVS